MTESAPREWQEAPWVQPLDEAAWFEAIAQRLAHERDEELALRLQAWWAGNEPYRRGVPWKPFSQRSQVASDNLHALQALCSRDEPAQQLFRAEALRELERFEEACGVLAAVFPEELQWVADIIRALALQGIAAVQRLEGTEEAEEV